MGGNTSIEYLSTSGLTGDGGRVTVTYDSSEYYTISDDFEISVKFEHVSDYSLELKGSPVLIGYNIPFLADNALGNDIYFDYDHDISNWLITKRSGDIVFSDLSESDLHSYLSDYSLPNVRLANVIINIKGKYSEYSFQSILVYDGYRTA